MPINDRLCHGQRSACSGQSGCVAVHIASLGLVMILHREQRNLPTATDTSHTPPGMGAI
jgi:hypothetical protein